MFNYQWLFAPLTINHYLLAFVDLMIDVINFITSTASLFIVSNSNVVKYAVSLIVQANKLFR
jgi:hypothetical protein